jgi:hypothetical protein
MIVVTGYLTPQHLRLRWKVHSDFVLKSGLAVAGTQKPNVVVST